MDCPPRRRENARAVRDMIRGVMESVFPQIGPKIGISSACGALEHKVRRSFRGIGRTLRNRSGNEAESQRERRSLRLRRCRWRAQARSRCRQVRTSPAARRIERTIPWYPVQRQRLPLIATRTAAASGSGMIFIRSQAVISMPGVQKPHRHRPNARGGRKTAPASRRTNQCQGWHRSLAVVSARHHQAPVRFASRAAISASSTRSGVAGVCVISARSAAARR
jgi:hypothetical protein